MGANMIEYNRDQLTGLPRKEEFEHLLDIAVNEDKGQTPISLAFFDVDDFLRVNTNHGHVEGDRVLKEISELFLSKVHGDRGSICRIGGDEFAVILHGTEKEAAFLELESMRDAIEKLKTLEKIGPRPTVSIGVATYPDDGVSCQEIKRKADDALYRAKSDGRNRVILAREEKKLPKTSHFTQGQLNPLSALSSKEGVGEAELLREALDDLLKKYSS